MKPANALADVVSWSQDVGEARGNTAELLKEVLERLHTIHVGSIAEERLVVGVCVQAVARILQRNHGVAGSKLWAQTVALEAGSNSLAALDACLNRLAATLVEERLDGQAHAIHPKVRAALDIVERTFGSGVSLYIVAAQVGLSTWHLQRLLRRDCQMSFCDYVRRCRVEEAKRLLKETNLITKEIAAEVGYRRTQQLDRDFRRLVGLTPKAFRREAHQRK